MSILNSILSIFNSNTKKNKKTMKNTQKLSLEEETIIKDEKEKIKSDTEENIFKENKTKKIEKVSEQPQIDYNKLEFHWIKGEYVGSIEYFKNVENELDNEYIVFISGNRINKDLLDEYIMTFPKNNKVTKNKSNDVLPIKPNKEKEYSQEENISPVFGLLDKQKKNIVSINIEHEINIPKKELYDILVASFDGAENDIINYIMKNIDIDKIKESIAKALKNIYN